MLLRRHTLRHALAPSTFHTITVSKAGVNPDPPNAAAVSCCSSLGRLTLTVLSHACASYHTGKTTQVPQYILEEAVAHGAGGGSCNIVCTQPRRLSAIGVAERVAAERGERVGESSGYSIKGESRRSGTASNLRVHPPTLLLAHCCWHCCCWLPPCSLARSSLLRSPHMGSTR